MAESVPLSRPAVYSVPGPRGTPGCGPWRVAVSRTLTCVEFEQATYRVFPSGLRTISVGWRSVAQVPAIVFAARSMTATAALFHRLTNRRFPPGSARQEYG